jgi:hypothetical protein
LLVKSCGTGQLAKPTAHAARYRQSVESKPIDPSYHVHANPASMDYLIQTVVTVPGASEARISLRSFGAPELIFSA